MKKAYILALCAATLAAAPQAIAQGAAATSQAAPAATFTDIEVKAYAGVAAKLSAIQADAAIPEADKQAKMAAAVQQSGLAIPRFNEITEASKTDPALQQRLQAATSAQ